MDKPSEKIVRAAYEGKDVTDALGRVIKLRKPGILDILDLIKALGDDAKNQAYFALAYNTLYVGMIDGKLVSPPKTDSEVRAILQRLEDHGIAAINEGLAKYDAPKNEAEALDSAKK